MSTDRSPSELAEQLRLQRDAWTAAAPGWDRTFDTFEAFAGPLSLELARAARIADGDSVIDVGCGNGEPSLTVARIVGPSGRVVGVDLALPMVENARRRALGAGFANCTFHAGGAQDLAGLGPFDAAVSRFVLMLVPEPVAAARAIRSVLRPGARLAACVWGEGPEVPFCSVAPFALERALGVAPAAADAPGPLRLGKPGAFADVLRAGGFVDIEEHTRRVEPRFASVEDGVRFYTEGSGSVRRTLDAAGPEDRARFAEELARVLAAQRGADGSVVLTSTVRIAHGTAT